MTRLSSEFEAPVNSSASYRFGIDDFAGIAKADFQEIGNFFYRASSEARVTKRHEKLRLVAQFFVSIPSFFCYALREKCLGIFYYYNYYSKRIND